MELAEKIEEKVKGTIEDSVRNGTELSFLDFFHRDLFGEPLSEEYSNYALDAYSIYRSEKVSEFDSKYLSVKMTMGKMCRDWEGEKKDSFYVSEDLSGLSRT
jgi:hypothetical protein